MSYKINNLVSEIGTIGIEGNIIPPNWYKKLLFDSGKPNFVAIVLLSEIFYWYRPTHKRDETTGAPLSPTKKFKADFLQRSTKSIAEQFGFTIKQVKDALRFLEEKGYIKRHFRTIRYGQDLVCSNVQFIEIIPSAIKLLQEIPTSGPASPEGGTHKSVGEDLQGGTYTETSSKTSTKKDNVLTMPSSKDDRKKRTLPDRFINKLNLDQRKIHDQIIKFVPQWGQSLKSDDVCAWFLSKKYTTKQVIDAFMVYRQDAEEAHSKGRSIDNMGGAIVAVIKSGRTPKNAAFEANKQMAIAAARGVDGMEAMDQYVKFRVGNDEETLKYNLPSNSFSSTLADYKRKTQMEKK